MRSFSNDIKPTVNSVSPFFSFREPKKGSDTLVQRAPDEEWVKDKGGNLFYKTKEEAEARKKSLEKKEEWTEYRIESFKDGGEVFWRVLMRGPKSTKKEEPKPEEKKPEEKKPEEKKPEEKKPASADPVFALTFDDGPHAGELGKGTNRTEKVLDVLKSEGIKAAFFIQTGVDYRGASAVGKKLVKRMADEGHDVGVHTGGTADHELHTKAAKSGTLKDELESAKTYVKDVTGSDPIYVRPPTGAFNEDVSKIYGKVGLTNLLWDIDGDQGKNLDYSTLTTRLDSGLTTAQSKGWKPWVQKISSRIVVLYHDIQKGTADNIAKLIAYIRAKVKALGGGSARFDKP